MLIQPMRQGASLLADIAGAREERGVGHLWWLGQSGFLLHWEGRFLLFDPYLSDSLTRKYEGTEKPHVRMTERVIDPGQLEGLDAVTSSHNHTDHLDAATLNPLLEANTGASMVVPAANQSFAAERLGVPEERLSPIDAGERLEIGPFAIDAVPAAHEELSRDDQGRYHFLGLVVGFGPWRVYHSGDTLLYDGIEDWVRPHAPHAAILPVNGRVPERRVAGNLDGPQAAWLGARVGARQVIPCHFEMFEFNTASPEPFVDAARKEGVEPRVMRAGERWSTRELA